MIRLTTILTLYFAMFSGIPCAEVLALDDLEQEEPTSKPLKPSPSFSESDEDSSPRSATIVQDLINRALNSAPPPAREFPRPSSTSSPYANEDEELQAAIRASIEELEKEDRRRALKEDFSRMHQERDEKRRKEKDEALQEDGRGLYGVRRSHAPWRDERDHVSRDL